MKTTAGYIARILCISACIILLAENSAAEEKFLYVPHDYSIVPPAPEVGQFFTFKDYPVDYFHGVPEISFTLYTLKYGRIEVPITLSYHGGGFQVKHKYGNAGLGWTVSYGAQISHTVIGAPDDANSGNMRGLLHLNDDGLRFRDQLMKKEADYDPTDGDEYQKKRLWMAILGDSYYCGHIDVANDRFSLFGLGLSADFVFDKNNEFSVSSEKPLKIMKSAQNSPINLEQAGCDGYGFEVKDQNGLSYQFLTQDRTKYCFMHGDKVLEQREDSLYYASAWHLDNINDLNGNIIKYNYHQLSDRQTSFGGHNTEIYMSQDAYRNCRRERISSCNSIVFYPQIIDSITAGGIKVIFEYLYENESVNNTSLIKSIKIEGEDGSSRIFSFIYSMKAEPILRQVLDGDDIIYSFEYNEEYNFDFPTFSQDFGGYFNDIQSNVNLVPAIANYGGQADRSVIEDAAKNGVLTKIIYPTGGFSEFEWENNIMKYVGSSEYKGTLSTTKSIKKTETYTLRMCMDPSFQKLDISGFKIVQGQTATLNLAEYYNMNPANLYGTDYYSSHKFHVESYSQSMPFDFPHVRIIRESDNHVMAVFALDKETIEDGVQPIPISSYLEYNKSYKIELVKPLDVSNSNGFLEDNMRYGDSPAGRIYVNKITYSDIGTGDGLNLWPGVRIKYIHSSTGGSLNDDVYKWFFYNTANDPEDSSGTVQRLPEYEYHYYKMFASAIISGCEGCEVINVGDIAFPGTYGPSMSSIEYPYVMTCLNRQYADEPTDLSHIREYYEYTSSQNIRNCDYNHTHFLSYQPIGSRIFTSRGFRRGILLKKKMGENFYDPESTVEYTYNIFEKDDSLVLTTDAFLVSDFTEAPGINPYRGCDYGIGTYRLIPYNKTVSTVTSTQKYGISRTESYEYFYKDYTDNLDFNLVKSKSVSGTEYGNLVYHYTYARNGGLYLPLPETEIVTCGNTVVSAKRTEYDALSGLPLRVYELSVPSDTATLISTNQATTALQRSLISTPTYQYRYNSNGNLIEIKYRDKVLASYLWGYHGMYPIIEAIGTPYEVLESNAAATGISISGTGATTLRTQTEISQKASALRALMPGTEIKSIAYHWIFGMIEMTDGRGVPTSYGYDNRGRLYETRDFNNFLISRYEYHYSNTPENDEDDE